METTGVDVRPAVPRAIAYAFGLAVLWAVLAAISPETTYHLAPFLVAGTAPVLDAADDAPSSSGRIAALAAIGTVLGLAATAILATLDVLQGPSLLPTGGAVLEGVVFSFTGGIVGLIAGIAIARR